VTPKKGFAHSIHSRNGCERVKLRYSHFECGISEPLQIMPHSCNHGQNWLVLAAIYQKWP